MVPRSDDSNQNDALSSPASFLVSFRFLLTHSSFFLIISSFFLEFLIFSVPIVLNFDLFLFVAQDELKGLDADLGDDKLKLSSADNEEFDIEKKIAIQSELIKTMVESGTFLFSFDYFAVAPFDWIVDLMLISVCLISDKEERLIPLPNVKSKILVKVIEYMRYHAGNAAKEIDRPLKSANMREVVSEWDADFVDVDDETLFDLILVRCHIFLIVLCFFPFTTGCQLHGHQAIAGSHVRQGGILHEGQDCRRDSQAIQH
jgi:hypothetical protein